MSLLLDDRIILLLIILTSLATAAGLAAGGNLDFGKWLITELTKDAFLVLAGVIRGTVMATKQQPPEPPKQENQP